MLKKIHLNAFPAIHLKNLDRLDFVLKFSSELVVLVLAAVAVFCNLYFFTGNVAHEYSDNSHAAKFLSYHPGLNQQLYAKNTSLITTIAKNSGFIQQAQADSFQGLSSKAAENENTLADSGDAVLNNGVLITPNPDSINGLIAKQVKIYETKSGDTLKGIASTNGISAQTIMWANKLTSEQIKPGWFLLILPIDGVLHKATSNDTLPDIAKKYKVDIDTIISYNALESPEDINPGQLLIIPGGQLPQPPKPKPVVPKRDPSKVGGGGAVEEVLPDNSLDDGKGHIFPKGYCTWYVAQKLGSKIKWGGNANQWIKNSRAYGAITDMDPAPGTIVVTTDSRRYGHVALVEQVTANSIIVSEMNYEKFGKVNKREIPLNSKIIKGFIHP